MDKSGIAASEIIRRLEHLERANRKLRAVAVTIGAVVVLQAAIGVGFLRPQPAIGAQTAPISQLLRTQRLELVDKGGKVLAILGIGKDGNPKLVLKSKDGRSSKTLDPFERRDRRFAEQPPVIPRQWTPRQPWPDREPELRWRIAPLAEKP
ncbi:MAG: hypothetical protein Q7T82_07375 [Armatimonadota bacterium]|nr:hypothetical protein [Armatimonadota bacterium]